MKLQDFDFRIWSVKKEKYIDDLYNNIISLSSDKSIKGYNRNYKILAIEFSPYDSIPLMNDNEECFEIELFTGFYDKKGNKIYEGDVIKYVYIFKHELLDKGMIKNLPKKVSIGYIGIDNFLGFRILKNKELQCFMKDIANIEIIGNIHENADLLKELK
ncbi:hypothetical protein HXS07_001581 [Campylobacter coli]|nr:hypothetical protein [Campylobacter coli]